MVVGISIVLLSVSCLDGMLDAIHKEFTNESKMDSGNKTVFKAFGILFGISFSIFSFLS